MPRAAPGRGVPLADFADAFDLTAYVLAALAVGTALLAIRLGRVPASAETAGAGAEGGRGLTGGEKPAGVGKPASPEEPTGAE
ncbi:hypothetical protein [Streptomyces sp. NPDC050416]|uniref:hypothetical protein n=1 Tax=Streptomyces sp. NPDC050416 TaxID=3365611 RepID=UPI00379B7272